MIKKYLDYLWRKTLRNKGFTLINIFGLSVGISVFILITLWVQSGFSYDRFNKNLDNICRIEIGGSPYMVSAIAQAYSNEFPEIEKAVRLLSAGPTLMTYEDKSIFVDNIFLADSTLFDIFSYEFIAGNPAEALVAPFTVVLTESTAKTIFGGVDVIGKSLMINNNMEAVVTGVVKDLKKTHMPADAIASFVTLAKVYPQPDFLYSFGTTQFATYFLLGGGTDYKALEKRMTDFSEELFRQHNPDKEEIENKLIPLKDIYFHEVHYPMHKHGNLKFAYIFMLVSLLTLVIACFNFINLTIAKSATVSREVGVKKVFGASRDQLFSQFLFESVILCFVSSLFALTIIQIIIPQFNQVAGSDLSLSEYLNFKNIILFFILVIIIGSMAGIYPAIRLSSFSPVHYLKKFDGSGKRRSAFKTGLVIFQYTVSIVLILSVFVVVRQISYMKDFKTGFNGENVIVLNIAGEIDQKMEAFRSEIKAVPGVNELSFSSAAPGDVNNYEGFSYMGLEGGFPVFTVDPSFFPMLDIKIREGRNFAWDRPNDRRGVCILNKEAVDLFKIDDPVGKFLKHEYYLTTIPKSDIEIIGVLDDYHYLSPKDTIGPALFCYGDWYNTVSIKISGTDINGTLKAIESVWNKFAPGFPFTYSFLNDNYELQYKTEATLSTVLVFFALIALVIACLGLLGLVSFLAQEKTKEIGIRKVFGATSGTIMTMLSGSFLKWVIIAILAGTPVAIIVMNKWLMTFAFHTSVSWWLVVLAGLVLLSISLSTIIYHIAKVSATNPVNVLKYE